MHQVVPGRRTGRVHRRFPAELTGGRGPARRRPPGARPASRLVALLGPAFVAAVAYIDPGNFATNFSAGAKFGYALVWVVVLANLVAMLVQYVSAKPGVASGQDLPEICRERFPRACPGACGCRPSWSRWPPTWPSSSAPPSA